MINITLSGFIGGRDIFDNYVAASECICDQYIKKRKDVVLKSNLIKAYDRVNWRCLFRVLQLSGFDQMDKMASKLHFYVK